MDDYYNGKRCIEILENGFRAGCQCENRGGIQYKGGYYCGNHDLVKRAKKKALINTAPEMLGILHDLIRVNELKRFPAGEKIFQRAITAINKIEGKC